jgi:hypothetical protein
MTAIVYKICSLNEEASRLGVSLGGCGGQVVGVWLGNDGWGGGGEKESERW